MKNEMKIEPVLKIGDSWTCSITASYNQIVKVLGFEPNVTHLDDPSKVKASWGFTVDGVHCGIWCYKYKGGPKKMYCMVFLWTGRNC